MEIIRFLTLESSEEEYLFETQPPMTRAIVDEFNTGYSADLHLDERNERLVIKASLVARMKQAPFGPEGPTDFLAGRLSEAQAKVEGRIRKAADAKRRRFDEVAHFFSLPTDA